MVNDRINELFGQALDQTVPETWTTLTPAQLSKLKDKFAELIVMECARIGELKEQGYSEYDSDISVGWYMRQHFGVEEK